MIPTLSPQAAHFSHEFSFSLQSLETEIDDEDPVDYSLDRLRPELLSFGRRLLSLATPKPLHMLAQSTMALHTAQNIKLIMGLDSEKCIPDTLIPSARYDTRLLRFCWR